RRAAAQLLERLARLEQPPLRDAETLVGLALRDLELANRRARLLLPPIERIALLFGLPLLARELIALVREPRLLFGRVRQLRVVGDGRLLVAVVVGAERGDAACRLQDRGVELGGFLREPREHALIRFDTAAQLLDLPLGLENAAGFGAAAAGDEMGPAEQVAVEGRDGQCRRAARRRRALVAARDRRLADRAANRGAERAVHADDRRQRDEALGHHSRGRV